MRKIRDFFFYKNLYCMVKFIVRNYGCFDISIDFFCVFYVRYILVELDYFFEVFVLF